MTPINTPINAAELRNLANEYGAIGRAMLLTEAPSELARAREALVAIDDAVAASALYSNAEFPGALRPGAIPVARIEFEGTSLICERKHLEDSLEEGHAYQVTLGHMMPEAFNNLPDFNGF